MDDISEIYVSFLFNHIIKWWFWANNLEVSKLLLIFTPSEVRFWLSGNPRGASLYRHYSILKATFGWLFYFSYSFLVNVRFFSLISLIWGTFSANYTSKSEKSDEIFGTYRISSYICKYNPNGWIIYNVEPSKQNCVWWHSKEDITNILWSVRLDSCFWKSAKF